MALVHKLYDGTNTIDFTTEAGFYDLYEYVPQAAEIPGDGSLPPYVTEVIPVRINGTSDDNFAAELQTFHALQKLAAEYWSDQTTEIPVWYHQQLTSETGQRRSLVKSLRLEFADEAGNWFSPAPPTTSGKLARVIIERHPYWESTTLRDLPAVNPSAGLYHYYDPTAAGASVTAHDIVGDVGARIQRFRFNNPAGDDIGRIWMGCRSANKHGTLTDYDPVYECEGGTNNASESGITDHADATASGGNCVQVVETDLDWDDTWHEVCMLRHSACGSGDEDENYGTILSLLRAQVSAGTWEVQLRYGYDGMADDDLIKGQVLELTNTPWDIIEADIHTYPIRNLKALTQTDLNSNSDASQAIFVWARRTSGSGNLEVDCVLRLPLDEGYCILKDFDTTTASAQIYMAQSPDERIYTAVQLAGAFISIASVDAFNFTLPVGDCRILVIWAGPTASDISDDFDNINATDFGKYAERWASLRGAE